MGHLPLLFPSQVISKNPVRSGAVGTQAGTYIGSWHCRQQLDMLHHNASPEISFERTFNKVLSQFDNVLTSFSKVSLFLHWLLVVLYKLLDHAERLHWPIFNFVHFVVDQRKINCDVTTRKWKYADFQTSCKIHRKTQRSKVLVTRVLIVYCDVINELFNHACFLTYQKLKFQQYQVLSRTWKIFVNIC